MFQYLVQVLATVKHMSMFEACKECNVNSGVDQDVGGEGEDVAAVTDAISVEVLRWIM